MSPISSSKTNVFWHHDYTAANYAFDTTRKSGDIARAIEAGRADVAIVDPSPHRERTIELIRTVHDDIYVDAVFHGHPEHLASSQGFTWDEGIPTMAIAHSSGLVAAVTEVLTGSSRVAGSLSSGLHHARAGTGRGYCTFNGLAVAAEAALTQGAERILVLDLDAHGGGGTRSLCDPARVVQIDVSTSGFDAWDPAPSDTYLFAGKHDYLAATDKALDQATQAGAFDLVLYNAGMDPVTDSGVSAHDIAVREQRVASWAEEHDLRVVYALAGGYARGGDDARDALVDLHLLTVQAFA
jgi:acetoin utilization deacetylase AcuC-like enzyme